MNETSSNFTVLSARLRALTARMGLSYSDDEWADLLQQSWKENNLTGDEPVPGWLVDFVQCFIDGEETEHIPFRTPADSVNYERRCISFIDSVIGGEWENEGESESVAIDAIDMQGFIYQEGYYYYVICY